MNQLYIFQSEFILQKNIKLNNQNISQNVKDEVCFLYLKNFNRDKK